MVKRKRTVSTRENVEITHQISNVDQINEAKRFKALDPIVNVEKISNGLENISASENPTMPPASHTLTTLSGSSDERVPVNISSSLPDVPLPTPPTAVPQIKPTPQLRTSARVLNKQRREETKAEYANSVAANKKADSNEPEYPDDEDGNPGTGNNEKKRRRAWELWSMEDKDIFFESINECGKDFEAIQNYLTTKLRKKGMPGYQIKNKDQIRHFYYRTWHKISKHITFNEGVKKATQELYGLINFGELRKKIGGTLDERKGQKLQELIRKGSTSVRVKGKSVRVRTPICRALKKLNQIEEHREQGEVRVPQSVIVEMVPGSVRAWCHVQGLAHNPRVRVTTSLQKPLSALISHLQEKWRSSDLKLRETLVSRANFPLEIEPVNEPILRLRPPKGCNIKPLIVQPDVMMKSSAVSLQSHEARLRKRGEKLGKDNKRKESKSQTNKSGGNVGAGKEADELGKSKEQTLESERSGRNAEEIGNDIIGKRVLDIGDLDDFAGEASQEELEDVSDVEADCINSPYGENDEICIVASEVQRAIPFRVKEEPVDCLSPPPLTDAVEIDDQDMLDPNVKVKEEGESGDAIRQLMALETVANYQNIDDDAEVVCVGESTRLTAHFGDGQKGHTSSANQLRNAATEERVLATTPEPEEDEKDDIDGDKASKISTEAFVTKIRSGWTLSTVGGITVGELYLMFGCNKKLSLEYEFELETSKVNVDVGDASPANIVSSKEVTDNSPVRTGVSSISHIVAGLSTPTIASVCNQQAEQSDASAENEKQGANILPELLNPLSNTKDDIKDEKEDEKKVAAVENLSGMLTQLLGMARIILAKPPSDSCACGHVCGRGGGLRSPASGRGQGLFGVGRSPGNTRSPRNCRVTAVGSQSPGMLSPIAQASRSPLASKALKERNKPTSAKRLIPDQLDGKVSQADGNGNAEISTLISTPYVSIPSTVTTPDSCLTPVTTVGGLATASLTGVRVVVGTGGEAGEFRVPTAPAPRPVQSQQASFNAQLTKLLPRYNNRPGRRVMRKNVVVQRHLPLIPKIGLQPQGILTVKKADLDVGGGKGYIPLTKAPDLQSSQVITASHVLSSQALASSINIQSSEAVQRQILQSSVTLLPPEAQSSIPVISTNQQTANAISVSVSGQPLLTMNMPIPVSSSTKTILNSSTSSSISNVTNVQVLTSPLNLQSAELDKNEADLSSGSLTVQNAVLPQKMQPSMPMLSTNPSVANAISVNVAGQPILTVEMPVPMSANAKGTCSPRGNVMIPEITSNSSVSNISDLMKPLSQGNIVLSSSLSKSPIKCGVSGSDLTNPLTPRKIDNLINSTILVSQSYNILSANENKTVVTATTTTTTTTTTSVKASTNSSTSINGLLSSIASAALSEIPDLSTPPGTPQPFCSTKSASDTSFLSHLDSITSSASTTTSYPCLPSPSLFNSSLSMDSLPSLNNGALVNTPLVSALPSTVASEQLGDISTQSLSPTPSITSLISSSASSLSLNASLLPIATTSHLELSPPPMQTNTFSSLLNTPTPHSVSDNSSNTTQNVSPSTPLSAMLHSPPSRVNKSFSALLDSPPQDRSSPVLVPELHIPEGSINLPLLDISIGGTVTLAGQSSGLLNNEPVTTVGVGVSADSSLKVTPSSPLRSSTPTSSVMNNQSVQGTSSDKLLDITLGTSNSNSSFSSLLASATQAPRVLDSSILGALNMDNLDCGTESGNRGVGNNVLEGISGVEISGFPTLDSSTPSPPSSPSRLLQQSDNQWLNNEVNDFSLSSLLGHLESPVKGSSSRTVSQSNSHETLMPSLVSVYNENSVDFTAKFAEMKAQASQVYKH